MAVRSRLDLESVLAQLEEEFRTAEEEYEASRDQGALAEHSDDDEEGITDLSSLRTSVQFDVTIVAREGEAEGLEVTASAREGEAEGLEVTASARNGVEEGLCSPSTSQSDGGVTQPAQEEDASHLCDSSAVSVEHSFEDKEEDDKIVKFMTEACGCTLGPNKSPCSGQFSQLTITLTRSNCLQLARKDLDLVVMAQLNALRTNAASKPSSYRGDMATFRPFTSFYLHGLQICRKTFCFVHVIGRERFENLCKAVDRNGVVQRLHGNSKLPRHNQIAYSEVFRVREFITNVGITHGSPLPGRLPNATDKTLLLPSDMPKSKVYRDYRAACAVIGVIPVGRSKFYDLWQALIPHIATIKPSSDLCFECQQNIAQIMRSAHLSEDEKSERLQHAEAHLRLAKEERERYNAQIAECRNPTTDGNHSSTMHYSFDYAQQVHFPNKPQQPGPAFFLTARKCQIFGMACEPLGTQVNYLIDESENVGKGANATVSLVHHYLANHGQKEDHLLLHADNCVGQNKNNCLIQYLSYRVLMGQNKTVKLSFMLAGHTKFAPDRHFGLIKKLYRRTRVDTINCIARIVRNSSQVGGNIPQVITATDGETLVKFFNWSQFLSEYFKVLPLITSYHTFRFDHQHPGVVFVRKYSQSPEHSIQILKCRPNATDTPQQILPKGLDLERQWYLFEKIRPFCSCNLAADITCPQPSAPKPHQESDGVQNHQGSGGEPTSLPTTAGTKRRTCSVCKESGHNKRGCPSRST